MMAALQLTEIAQAIGGAQRGNARIESVSTDSRSAGPGDLFVALTGEHFDGHDFLVQVEEAGAAAALVSRANDSSLPQIQLEDTRWGLGKVAQINRQKFSGPLIALTGSAGKTTCKEMIAAILSQCGNVLATQGNFNNEIGVPLTLLALCEHHDYAVIEMGAAKANDISYLTQFAEPTIALLTNAMTAHIEGFGDLATVARTKGQILESVAKSGIAIINRDDPFSAQWQQQAGEAEKIYFSCGNDAADFYAEDIQCSASGANSFQLCTPQGKVAIQLPLLGRHNVMNAVAASAAAMSAGAELQQIKRGLESVEAVQGRLQSHLLGDHLVIDDSYNANPESVKAAIDVLAGFKGVRYLVLGEMAEQGDEALAVHREVVAYAAEQGIDQLYMVGNFAEQCTAAWGHAYASMAELLADLKKLAPADVVLVKGSRSAGMERVVNALIEARQGVITNAILADRSTFPVLQCLSGF